MKTSAKIASLAAALLLAASGASIAAEPVNPYVHSSSGQVVKTAYNLCVRTGFWTPAYAEALGASGDGCACDADILDAAACKAVETSTAAEKVTFSADMLFAYNRSVLSDEGKAVLDDLVSRIAGVDLEVILSTGYADRIGSDQFNQRLSLKRAEAVKSYLVSKGVDATLIQTEGKGESDPVVNCPNPSSNGQIKNFRELVRCLAPNRRAVVEVVGTRPAE